MVEANEVVEVEAKRVDASRSDSTKVLSDKSDIDNFSNNVLQTLHFDLSFHAKL